MKSNFFETNNAINKLIINKKKENIIASFIFKVPAAIGLNFLIGWILSSFISITSFKRYIALDIKQKQIRAKNDLKKTLSSKLNPKIGAANTNKFFVHCLGLQDVISDFDLFLINFKLFKLII